MACSPRVVITLPLAAMARAGTFARGMLYTPASTQRYEELIRLHIAPAIGKIQPAKLTRKQVDYFYTSLLEAGKGRASLGLIHTVLHRALDRAVKWEIVPNNVTDRVDPPTRGKAEAHPVWNREQEEIQIFGTTRISSCVRAV
jgi:hypothetical protein